MRYKFVERHSYIRWDSGYGVEVKFSLRKFPHEISFDVEGRHDYTFRKNCSEMYKWLIDNLGDHRDKWVVLANHHDFNTLGFKEKDDALLFKVAW